MYLSTLDLHGFKSFAQKTTLEFASGITAIVGPNGCGKSNVIDAVRWVLGEQRPRLLRSDSMAGVIFNGSPGKKPLGMAEVALTVENTRGILPTEYGEVTVARRLYRSGDSEYVLNGSVCRLKDILELFMDTGVGAGAYSVIELKMIEDILSENADDRRRLFEEAAGVTKYKRRRHQALLKLDTTQNDLARLSDRVDEIEKQVRSLKRQAKKARKHQILTTELRGLELALAAHDHARLQAERETLADRFQGGQDEAEAHTAQVAREEAALEQARASLVEQEQTLTGHRTALSDHAEAIRRMESKMRVLAERREATEKAQQRLDREAQADAARLDALTTDEEALRDAAEAAKAAQAEAAEALSAAGATRDEAAEAAEAARETRDARQAEQNEAAQAQRAAHTAVERLADRRAMRAQERERLDAEQADLDARRDAAPPESGEGRTGTAEAVVEAAARTLTETREDVEAAQENLEAAETRLGQARVARDSARAQIEFLKSLVASTRSEAAVFLATDAETPLTSVADLVGCDEADRLALDAALGAWADCLVVHTRGEAETAITRLQETEKGRATFLVLDRLHATSAPPSPSTPSGTTPVRDLARMASSEVEPLLDHLLHDAFVVGSLGQALALQDDHPHARFVTPDGAWTDGAGAVHGGSAGGNGAAQRLGTQERLADARERLAEAERNFTEAEQQVASAREAREAARTQRDTAEAALEEARSHLETVRTEVARREASRAALDAEAERLARRRAELDERAAVEPDLDTLKATASEAAEAAAAAERALAEATITFDEADRARRRAESAWGEARLAHAQAQARAEAARRDLERNRQAQRDVARRQEERQADAERFAQALAETAERYSELEEKVVVRREGTAVLREAVEAAETVVLEARARIAELEQSLREARRSRESVQQQIRQAEVRLTQIATRQESIEERLRDEHGVTLTEAADVLDRLREQAVGDEEAPDASLEETFDAEAARERIPDLRDKVRRLGAVNELALESYEEERERLDFMTEQRRDLEDAEASLLDTIEEINETAGRRFRETFGAVREAFQRLFSDLFGEGASADLTLSGDDPLEASVEITARPRGKRPVSLSQLSGGEKTLTAIALLFAIYFVKPSPFCILDEVDAPLDDANVQRFMRLLRSFSDDTQFILVTHNKLTMEAADRMYGVTMPDPGISRLVSVNFEEADALAETEAALGG